MISGFQLSQMIHVAAKLRIADQLAGGPRTVAQLAAATKTHADSLYRVLRTLAGMGIFAEDEDLQFRLTPAAELLRSEVPGSMRAHAEAAGEEWMWRPWGALVHSVTTGDTAFDQLYGKNTFDWFGEHPDATRLAASTYTENTATTSEAIVAAYDFSAARTWSTAAEARAFCSRLYCGVIGVHMVSSLIWIMLWRPLGRSWTVTSPGVASSLVETSSKPFLPEAICT